MTSRFSITHRDAIARIVFDDGGMNLLSLAALDELDRLLGEIPDGTRVVEFRSGRGGIFAAGADMAEMRRFSPAEAERFSERGQVLFRRIESAGWASVAAIDGDCFGGALDLVMAFDARVATRRSRFSHPGSRIGIVTGFGGTSRWRSVVPRHRAARLMLSGEVLDADAARKIELIDEVVDRIDRHALELVQRLAATGSERIRFAKDVVGRAGRHGARATLEISRRLAAVYAQEGHGTD